MPLVSAPAPFTNAQHRRRWVIAGVILTCGLSAAIWAAIDCSHIQFGYAAGYSFATMFFLSAWVILLGLPMLLYWRTRTSGIAFIVTGFSIYLAFLGTLQILKRLDRVAWMHEPPMQSFGPDQSASLVIYYRPGTTDAQIEEFVNNKLEQPAEPRHTGKDYPEFVESYLRLIPEQANGYDASALSFRGNQSNPAVGSYVAMIQSDPRVLRVFRDVSPEAIHLPNSERAKSIPNTK
jgi:hypothetical protein